MTITKIDLSLKDRDHTFLLEYIEALEESIKELNGRIRELEILRSMTEDDIVWGFYEERVPQFVQGKSGAHELTSPVTAGEVTAYVAAIEKLEAQLKTARNDALKEAAAIAEDIDADLLSPFETREVIRTAILAKVKE